MTELAYRVAELERCLANLLRLGRVEGVDLAAARVQVRSGALVTAWLPWVTRRAGADADWWAPAIGEQVLLLAPGGDLAQGVVLPALYQSAHPAPAAAAAVHATHYADGGYDRYDQAAGAWQRSAQGPVEVTAGGAATLEAADLVTLAGGGSTAVKGVVQGDCLCAYTRQPHPMVSATVVATP